MRDFPFPDRIESREELKRDVLYDKIPEEDRIRICDAAWETGVKAAAELGREYPGKKIDKIMELEGIKIVYKSKDCVAGGIRYFSEYFSGKREIVMYVKSIEKWANSNGVSKCQAMELILAHEFYHHLECNSIGLTSQLYMLPTIKIGKLSVGRSGIRALSEIGAHGFSRTYYNQWGCCNSKDGLGGNKYGNT